MRLVFSCLVIASTCALALMSGPVQSALSSERTSTYEDLEGYAVLSILLNSEVGNETSVAKISLSTDPGLGIPAFEFCAKKLPEEYRAAILDFTNRNAKIFKLQKRFDLKVKYEFSRNSEAATGKRPFYSVSAVGFDDARDHAVAYVAAVCGFNCFGGTYHFLKKQQGNWVEVSGARECEYMASNLGPNAHLGFYQ